jgi:putative ABC transport system permease protein
MFKLILHSIRMRLVQGVSISFAAFVGVAVLLAFVLVTRGVSAGVETAEERGGAKIMLVPSKAKNYLKDDALLFSGAPVNYYMPDSTLEKVLEIEGAGQVTAQFFAQTLDASCCSASGETRLVGIDTATDWLIPTLLDSNQGYDGALDDSQIIIGSNVTGFESGTGKVLGRDVFVTAILAPTGTGLDRSIVVDIDSARRYAAESPGLNYYWEQYGKPDNLISAVLLNPEPESTERVLARLGSIQDTRAIERSTVVERSTEQLSVVFNILLATGIVMALASLLQLFARYWSVAWERRSEFGLYRALGATRSNIRRLIGGEAFILSGVGIIAGLVGGGALFSLLSESIAAGESFPFITPDALFVLCACLGIALLFLFLTALAVLFPLVKISRIDPSQALQQVDIS